MVALLAITSFFHRRRLVCGTIMLTFALLHESNVYVILLPMIGYMFCLGSTMPVARTYLMDLHADKAGTASSLTGIIIAIVSSIMTYITSHYHINTIFPVASILTCTTLLGWFSLVIGNVLFKHKLGNLEHS